MTDKTETTPEVSNLNIYQRIAKAMETVTYIKKEKKGTMQYAVVSHDDVTAKVRPALLAAGVIYHPVNMTWEQNGNRTEMFMDIKFINIADPSDFIEVPTLGFGIDSQDKGPGKAVSYAVKMALLKTMGLETGLDPDNDQNTEHEPDKPMEKKNPPGITKLKAALTEFYRDMNACEDPDSLTALSSTSTEFLEKLKVDYPAGWLGDGGDIKGLRADMKSAMEILRKEQTEKDLK